ncbi:hypothetical protein [Alysiella filiformis]|uniref:DUF3828 domain-containing protein n=1 Tax=Alysiella filiformis DSM 16848 TaxID=1120981 RepID=A0A286EBW1_9NEIS|nr:hypothetical protein [Alysiella filiformis]QMT31339.1 hypothetical protein H3L97_11765 [Alysiella filiformis]UBQ55654.1 hypothetical protein JF568_08700 [Alysiella filiformis DSM 16848]SOD68393.1 hypothetical protein SAMN02746062_01245 [Alysiella filiformis DSM 16848]
MKKLLALAVGFALINPAYAQDFTKQKIQLIQKMYDDGRKQDDDVIMDYADKDLKKLYQRNLKVMEQEEAYPCIEFSPMWNSQDPQTKVKVQVSALQNGKIRAQFIQYKTKETVDYEVTCNQQRKCAVGNVFNYADGEVSNFAKNLAACLKEQNG